MALKQLEHQVYRYICLSTDTKPTTLTHGTLPGSTLLEYNATTETIVQYILLPDEETWVVKDLMSGGATPDGDSFIDDIANAIKVTLASGTGFTDLTDLYNSLEETNLELRRIARILELTLGEEVTR